jgi:hypothetical protein
MARTIENYKDFWPFYLAAHSKAATRGFHYVGTASLVTVVGFAVWFGEWWLLLLALPALYSFAWFSHFMIEGNKPATFTHPLWSLVSDFRMAGLALTGRMPRELRKYQIRSHP